jgi:hypothetical protein
VSIARFIHSIIATMMHDLHLHRSRGRSSLDRDDSSSIDASSRLARVDDASPSRCVRREVDEKKIQRKIKHPFVEQSLARGRRASTLLTLEDEWTNARIDRVDAMTTR